MTRSPREYAPLLRTHTGHMARPTLQSLAICCLQPVLDAAYLGFVENLAVRLSEELPGAIALTPSLLQRPLSVRVRHVGPRQHPLHTADRGSYAALCLTPVLAEVRLGQDIGSKVDDLLIDMPLSTSTRLQVIFAEPQRYQAGMRTSSATLSCFAASRPLTVRSVSASSVTVCNRALTLAGCPTRTVRTPAATSPSARLSAAAFVPAHARIVPKERA